MYRTPSSTGHSPVIGEMSALVKIGPDSVAAEQLQRVVFTALVEIVDSSLTEDALARYVVMLVCKGSDLKKMQAKLSSMIDPDLSERFLDW